MTRFVIPAVYVVWRSRELCRPWNGSQSAAR
jgi:hypothetical protein